MSEIAWRWFEPRTQKIRAVQFAARNAEATRDLVNQSQHYEASLVDDDQVLVVRCVSDETFVLEVGDWLTVAHDGAMGRLSTVSVLMGYQETEPDPEPSEGVPF
jgi:hypothetical protein